MSKTCKNNLFKRLAYLAIVYVLVAVIKPASAQTQQGTSIKTIVIDAGHGGKDPGAVGGAGHRESHLALAVALKFGALVQQHYPQMKIIYTRKTDVFLTLNERADIANKAKADLFFCIHLNSSTNRAAYGSSTYALGLHRTDENLEVAKRENAVIELEEGGLKNYEFNPNSPEGHIIMSMKQNAFLDQSLRIASHIEDEQEVIANRKSRGVKQAGFYVLYKTSMPSILTEIGFISNPEEEAFMASERGQQLIALSLFKGFVKYKNTIEGKNEKVEVSHLIPDEEPNNKPSHSEKPQAEVKPQSVPDNKNEITPTNTEKTENKTVENNVPIKPIPAQKNENDSIANPGLVYRVQLLAGNVPPKNKAEIEAKFGKFIIETLANGVIRFMVGNFADLKEAKSLLVRVQKGGFPDAFITAYENSQRVNNKRLAELLK